MKIRNSLGNGIRGSSRHQLRAARLGGRQQRRRRGDRRGRAALHEPGRHLGVHADPRRELAGGQREHRQLVGDAVAARTSPTRPSATPTPSRPATTGCCSRPTVARSPPTCLGNTFLRNRANGLQVDHQRHRLDERRGRRQRDCAEHVRRQQHRREHRSQLVGDVLLRRPRPHDRRPQRRAGTGGSASPINVNLASAATTPMVGKVTGNTVTNSNSTTGPGLRFTGNGSRHDDRR